MELYPDPVRIEWKHMAELRVTFPEVSAKEIASRVGRSQQTIYIWLRQPAYQAYENWVFQQAKQSWTPLERAAKADVKEMLDEYAVEMADRLRSIAESTVDEKLQAAIAQDWLDRSGFAEIGRAHV